MMATVPHVTSGSRLTKFQADEFFFDRVYLILKVDQCKISQRALLIFLGLLDPKDNGTTNVPNISNSLPNNTM